MIRLWQKISQIGLTTNLSLTQKNKIVLLNRIVAIFSSAIVVRIFFDVLEKDWTGIFITGTMLFFFLISYLFNFFHKYSLAQGYFINIYLILATVIVIILGKGLGGEFCFFSLVILSITFFEKNTTKAFYIFSIIIGYIVCQSVLLYHEPIFASSLSEGSYHFMFFSNMICTFLAVNVFIGENKKFGQQTIKLLESVKQQNTQLENTKKEIEVQNKKLESANKELEKFAYIASHDLKTPLRNINNFLQLIERKLKKEGNEDVLEYIGYATNSAQQMHYLIQDILEFSRLNGDDFVFGDVNLNDIVKNVKTNIKGYIEEKNAVVTFKNLPTIQGKESQVNLLFQNLIENAIKYNESETPTINITCIETHSDFIVTVSDNGIGISEEYFERVFEMFTRLHNQDTFQGSGIGLAICQKIAEYHGGKIELKSQPNKGSDFKIHFTKSYEDTSFNLVNDEVSEKVYNLN